MEFSQVAEAHIRKGEASGFLSGVRHPISGLDHVLAMIAVGLWGAQLGAPAIWVLPVAFPMVMALGGVMGLLGIPLPGTEYGIAASMIFLGGVVLLELKPPLWVAALLVSFFAIFHGHAHGTELPPGRTACCIAWDLSAPRAVYTASAFPLAWYTAGLGDKCFCGCPVALSLRWACISCGRRWA